MHKLREGILRGHNTGMLCGVQEVDGMDVNGRRYKEKRNKPQGGGRTPGKPAIPAELLKPAESFVGPPTPPKWGKAAKQNVERRLILVMRQRGVTTGKMSCSSRARDQSPDGAKRWARKRLPLFDHRNKLTARFIVYGIEFRYYK